MTTWKQMRALVLLSLVPLVCAQADGNGAVLCRASAFVGLDWLAQQSHKLLGPDTTDRSKIRLFITKEENTTYIQSNFRSADPDNPGAFADFPSKIRTNDVKDIRQALVNVIYWGEPPPEAAAVVEKALRSTTVFVDKAAIDQNGRIDVDIEGAHQIKLTNADRELPTGEIATLDLKDPPPALIETISGCCLKGRPPGRAQEIFKQLSSRRVDRKNTTMLSLVVDSGTDAEISKSSHLTEAAARARLTAKDDWQGRLDKGLAAARGGTLLVLSHINGKNVEVLDAKQQSLFSIPVGELRDRASRAGVDLILLGCDTAAFIDDNSGSVGVVGKYNTASAAAKLAHALPGSTDVATLLKAIASPDLKLVVYDEEGGNGYAGASAFAKVRGGDFWTRVFRVLSITRKS